MFDTWRFHGFFTTTDLATADTVAADKTHRGHPIIEQLHANLKEVLGGSPAFSVVRRERGLARGGRHRVQPHPGSRDLNRPGFIGGPVV